VHYPGALYHVISRGNQRQNVFRSKEDFERFKLILQEVQGQQKLVLYAYVLMPNHFHLLVQVAAKPLSKVMQSLLYRYTRYYNQRYRQVGHLFQGRYKAILCDRESYLLELVRYLHLNPVRAGMVKDPKRYPWSSHRVYLGGRDAQGVSVEKVLSRWSRRRRQAVAGYKGFVLEGIRQGHREEFYQVKEQRYLGDDEFVEKVEKEVEGAESRSPVGIALDEVVERVRKGSGKAAEEILGRRRGRREAELRALACYVAREVGGLTLTGAARYFRRDISALSMGVKRLEQKMVKDEEFCRRVHELCSSLRRGRRNRYSKTQA
jgi:REP element-mobilizing transposase RayT